MTDADLKLIREWVYTPANQQGTAEDELAEGKGFALALLTEVERLRRKINAAALALKPPAENTPPHCTLCGDPEWEAILDPVYGWIHMQCEGGNVTAVSCPRRLAETPPTT